MGENKPDVLEELSKKPEALVGMVSYQPDSIVSRRIIHRDSGNVTLFAFDEGQELTEHTSPFNALIYVVDGESEVFIAKKHHHLKAGEIILLPANVPHAVKAMKKFKMLLTLIRS